MTPTKNETVFLPHGAIERRRRRRRARTAAGLVAGAACLVAGPITRCPAEEPSSQEAGTTAADVQAETKEAAETRASYVALQREKAEAELSRQMEQWSAWLDQARRDIAEGGEAFQARIDQEFKQFQDQIDQARTTFDELKAAGGEDWESIKSEFGAAAEDVREHWTRLKNRMADEGTSSAADPQ